MKFLVFLAVAVACAAAENNFDGSYSYSYETGSGILGQEQESLKQAGGAQLSVAPEIPADILRSLE